MGKKNPITDKGIVVVKFGGTSLADNTHIFLAAERIAELKRAGNDHIVAVVSAQGNATDDLIALAKSINPDPDDRSLALLLSTGEQRSCALLTMALNQMDIKAIALTGGQAGIRTDGKGYLDAKIAGIDTRAIHTLLNEGYVVIVAGFQAVFIHDNVPEIALLGRGGSDTTAIHLACAISAGACILYKDVNGIFPVSPNVIRNAKILKQISLEELRQTAQGGAEVVSWQALEMLRSSGCGLEVRPMFSDELGTSVTIKPSHERVVSSITSRRETALVSISMPDGLSDTRFLETISRDGINIYLRGEDRFTIRKEDAQKVEILLEKHGRDLGITEHSVKTGFAQIAIVGEGMRNTPGVLGEIQRTLEQNNILYFLRATGDISAHYVVKEEDCERGIKALYHHFFDNPT